MRKAVSLLLLLSAVVAQATDFYIDYTGGNNSANGLTTGTAWKHCPGDAAATGNPLGYSPSPGDRFLFRRGVRYIGSITITWSGSSGNYITFDGNEWGSGDNAIISYNVANGNAFFVSGSRSYLAWADLQGNLIGGIPYTNAIYSGSSQSWSNVVGGAFLRAESNPNFLRGERLVLSDIGYNTNSVINWDGDVINGYGIRIRGGTGHYFDGVDGSAVPVLLSLQNGSFGVSNCTFINFTNAKPTLAASRSRWVADIAPSHSSHFAHLMFSNFVIGNIHDYDTKNWKGGQSSTLGQDNPHTDGFFIRAPINCLWVLTNGVPTVTVDGLKWYSDVVGAGGGGTAPIYISQGPSVLLRNIVMGPTQMGYNIGVGHALNTTTQVVYMLNCTLFYSSRINVQHASASIQNRKVYIYNSILHRSDGFPAIIFDGIGATNQIGGMDYNLYYSTVGSGWQPIQVDVNGAASGGITSYTLSAWRTFSGFDQHSVFGNPGFTNLLSTGANSDLNLLASSPGVGAGTNILHWVRFDKQGRQRTNTFDIGAFAYFTTSSGPAPDTDPPSPAPDWVSTPAIVSTHQIHMSWSSSSDASGTVVYEVQETTGNPGCDSTSTTDTEYTDDNVPFGTTCVYRVRARDAFANVTSYSTESGAVTPTIAQAYVFRAASMSVGGDVDVAVPGLITNLFYFDAEEAGLPAGYTTNGAAFNPDYTTVVWQGLQSFDAGDTTNISYVLTPKFTTSTNLSLVFSLYRNSDSGTPRTFLVGMNEGVEQFSLAHSTNGLHLTHGGVTNIVSMWSPRTNWYHGRINYASGTGANGLLQAVWKRGNRIFSEGVSNTLASGSATLGVNQIMLGHTNGLPGNHVVFDYTWARPGTNSIVGDNPTP